MEIHFCDLCNESVPQADLDSGHAISVKGRVTCQTCVAAMTGHVPTSADDTTIMDAEQAPPVPARPVEVGGKASPSASIAVALSSFALIFSVAAIGVLFDRGERRDRQLEEDIVSGRIALNEATSSIEQRFMHSVREATSGVSRTEDAIERLTARVDDLGTGQGQSLAELQAEADQLSERMAELDRLIATVKRNEQQLATVASTTADLHDGLLRIDSRLTGVEERGPEVAVEAPSAPQQELPEWYDLLADLQNQNSGKRWQAVSSLGATKDPAVAEHLTPMLKDPDIFVRMATARILGDLAAPIGIGPLIDALEDPETSVREAAVVSLRSLTGRVFKYDPSAREVERAKRVKAWRDWWKKAAPEILGQV